MPSQLFKFPGIFDREIDLTAAQVEPVGVPAGVIGASLRGPAFIPYTVGSFEDFQIRFGGLSPNLAAPYAADAFLKNRTALTFTRVLGAGANETSTDIETTRLYGTVKNAGFKLDSAIMEDFIGDLSNYGSIGQPIFLAASHTVTANEAFGFPVFTNNNTYFRSGSTDEVFLVRGLILPSATTIISVNTLGVTNEDVQTLGISSSATPSSTGEFVISIANLLAAQISYLTASLDPESNNYIGKVLNTDPLRLETEGYCLYADFAVDSSVAAVSSITGSVMTLSGSSVSSSIASTTFGNVYKRYDTRYTTPGTTWFISQPYGKTEYDLFRVEAIDDGAYANNKYKISIAGLQKSANPRNSHGTFSLLVRDFYDTDVEPKILEQYNNLSLDPESTNYIGRVIGDKKAYFNFDVDNDDDKRIVVEGKYENRSKLIRVQINPDIDKATGNVPTSVLPFGFRGQPTIKTSPYLADITGSSGFSAAARLFGLNPTDPRLLASVVPPVPHRFKITRGEISTAGGGFIGAPGSNEIVDGRYYWGVKFEKTENVLNPNLSLRPNPFIESNNKFLGITKFDAMVTGSFCDSFNDNKFTLARVAFGNEVSSGSSTQGNHLAQITSSVNVHMREACYIRDGQPDETYYGIMDNGMNRLTFATLFHKGNTSADFNRFSEFTKFSTTMFGGFDGVDIFDSAAVAFSDRSTSTEISIAETTTYLNSGFQKGNANSTYISPNGVASLGGAGTANNAVVAFRTAARIMTNPVASSINLLAVPGQRDPLVTDYVADAVRDFGAALYVQDIPSYDGDLVRVFDGDTNLFIDIDNTADSFEARALDNDAVATYFPSVVIDDPDNGRKVTVAASVAAYAALGFNDKVAYPWFAPAGFNRGALSDVTRTQVRIKQDQRERLASVNINPIVKFPNEGHVIFSQKTLKQDESALQSINVQRMVTDVKRQVIELGNKVLWDNIDADSVIYKDLETNISNILATVQQRQGIDRFRVICNNTNNTADDRNNNTINVRVRFVPTRSIEFITIDFIITRSGVSFS